MKLVRIGRSLRSGIPALRMPRMGLLSMRRATFTFPSSAFSAAFTSSIWRADGYSPVTINDPERQRENRCRCRVVRPAQSFDGEPVAADDTDRVISGVQQHA